MAGGVVPVRELPFVGRETPLGALVSAVQAAELGERVLGLVAGEPGIGKTRLVKELAARVSSRVLWGACWEGDGAPPYWVWLQLLRALGSGDDGQSGPAEHLIDAILQEAAADELSSDARFRLFDGITEVFATASQRRPLVLVLEDLHWADEASIRLLEFFGRDQRSRRVAVVGTYRDTDLDRSHLFARRLGELVRDGLHLSLGGLGKRDVGTLVTAMGEEKDLHTLVSLLHRQSGGNPFFLRELVRLWRDEGGLASPAPVPAGIRPVIARRLSRLSPTTQDVLAAAAVTGVDFDVSLLGAVTGVDTSAVLRAVDEAGASGLVVEAGATSGFSFVHALVREVLYEGLGLERRVALHGKTADAIQERYGDERLPEIAHHVLQAAVAGGDDRAVDLAVRAGEQSFALLAYEEAGMWFGRALDVLRAGHADDARVASLLIRQGEAHLAPA